MKLSEIAKPKIQVVDYSPEVSWMAEYEIEYKLGTKTANFYAKWKKQNPGKNVAHFVVMWRDKLERNVAGWVITRMDFNNIVNCINKTKVTSDGVNYEQLLSFEYLKLDVLDRIKPPFKFNYIERLYAPHCNFKSLDDIPDWFPTHSNIYNIAYGNIKTLSGIDKRVKECVELNIQAHPVKSSILSVLKIKKIKRLLYDVQYLDEDGRRAFNILYQTIKKCDGNITSRDILNCQSELLDADLDEYAQL